MARPPDADSAETYDRILQAAVDEIRTASPPTAISMRKVAERAEFSLGTLQYYFPKKDTLLEACLDEYHQRMKALGARLITEALSAKPPRTGRALIEPPIRAFYRFVREEPSLLQLRLITNTVSGELPAHRRMPMLGSLIGSAAKVLAEHVGIEAEDIPLTVQAVSLALTRFALMSDEEREVLAGTTDDTRFEEYLVAMSMRMLGLPA